jgi:hypothetical protein
VELASRRSNTLFFDENIMLSAGHASSVMFHTMALFSLSLALVSYFVWFIYAALMFREWQKRRTPPQ